MLLGIDLTPTTLLDFILAFALWIVIWTPVVALLEYIAHRWIMHKANHLLDPDLSQLRAHGKHHQGANHFDLVDVPLKNCFRLTAPFILGVLAWGWFVGPVSSIVAPLLALLTWCFVYAYLWNRMHRAIHDLEKNWFRRSGPIFRFFMNHHLQHHARARVNYGTVFPWTDYVFGTNASRNFSPSRSVTRSPIEGVNVETATPSPSDPGLLVRWAIRLSELSPTLKKLLWQRWYQHIAGYQEADWKFMNYGYSDEQSGQDPVELQPTDEEDRFAIQLYHRVASATNLDGLDVLEVGCGRGGGASFVRRYHGVKQMTGVDFSKKAVRFCLDRHQVDGLSFVHGDAEALPFADQSFDAVINVESSHCYRSMPAFLEQVNRVLRPGGYFLFADLRASYDCERLHQQLRESGLAILERENITDHVLEALQRDSKRKLALIENSISPRLLHTFLEFAGVEGSKVYRSFRDGELVYERYLLRKTLE